VLKKSGKIHTCIFFEEIHAFSRVWLGQNRQTPGFVFHIPDFTGLDQFHIPKMSDCKNIFLVQDTNFFKSTFCGIFCPFDIPFPTPPYWGAFWCGKPIFNKRPTDYD
jgi:hypothetical protein